MSRSNPFAFHPLPWGYLERVPHEWHVIAANGSSVATCGGSELGANARSRIRLLAAAPDLLAALQECAERLAYFYEEGGEHPAVKRATAAIEKAGA